MVESETEEIKKEIKELKQQLAQPLKSEATRTVKKTLKIFLVILAITVFLTSLGLNLWMIKNNDWHLQKRVWWRYQPYVVTQSFFDEKLSIERQDGYNEGYGIGYAAGDSAGYNRGYNAGYSVGYAAKTCSSTGSYEEGYYAGQTAMKNKYDTYLNENIDAICQKSQEPSFLDYVIQLLPLFL